MNVRIYTNDKRVRTMNGGKFVDFLEIVERSHTGEAVSKNDWDLDHVAMPIRDIVEDFDLNYEKGEVLAFDENMLRRFYAARRRLRRFPSR